MTAAPSKYDGIGRDYGATRRADPRIVNELAALLKLKVGQRIADVGAGTGTYARALAARGAQVIAVEPSAVMQGQAEPHPGVRWVNGSAEQLPLPDGSVDAVIVVLSIQHFSDLPRSFTEMQRVCRGGPIVVFTFDPWLHGDFWLYDYFPRLRQDARKFYPSSERVKDLLQGMGPRAIDITEYALPSDTNDKFAAAGWARPELYLDARVRQNMSPFRSLPADELANGLSRLEADLANGAWTTQFGHLREAGELAVGYVFVRAA